jgi:DNA-binding CsgD family transcriptional regulator
MSESDALAVPLDAVPPVEHPDLQFVRILAREGDGTEARRRIGRLTEAARQRGDWTSLPRLLVTSANIETDAGDWSQAEAHAEEAQIGLAQTGEGSFGLDLAGVRLWQAVLRGRADEARETGAVIERRGDDQLKPVLVGRWLALGSLELAIGDAEAALEWAERIMAQPGVIRLFPVWWEYAVALHLEALVGVGRVGEARLPAARLERRALRHGRAAALAEALRARAIVRAADGELESALESAEEAVEIHGALELPFRAARAWFTLGEVRRRARQRGAARTAFEAALDGFTRVGAGIWIDRTSHELERVAGRRPTGSALTDTERRVAELAAAGHTNKEIADALFMSVHTVEAHLTRVFRALGVQSRTELARADLDHPDTRGPAQP